MDRAIRAVVFDAVGTLLYAAPPVADVYHLAGWQHGSRLERDEIGRRLRAAFAASEASEEANQDGVGSVFQPTDSENGEGSNRERLPTSLTRRPTSESAERQRWRGIVTSIFTDVPDADGSLFRTLWNHFAQPENWRLFDDVLLVLSALGQRGLRLAVASNFDRRLHAIRAAHLPLAVCEQTFISSEIGYPKPDPRFFSAAAQQLGLPPDEILLVGDDWTNDILGAQAAGWKARFLDRKGRANKQGAIKTLAELLLS
jgi:putative hydrolase of the HAD superfamily